MSDQKVTLDKEFEETFMKLKAKIETLDPLNQKAASTFLMTNFLILTLIMADDEARAAAQAAKDPNVYADLMDRIHFIIEQSIDRGFQMAGFPATTEINLRQPEACGECPACLANAGKKPDGSDPIMN